MSTASQADKADQQRADTGLAAPFARGPVRAGVLLVWLLTSFAGGALMNRVKDNMETTVTPPSGTKAKAAKEANAAYFPPAPVTITVLLKSINGSVLVDVDDVPPVTLTEEEGMTGATWSYKTAGTAAAASLMGDLEKLTGRYSDVCDNLTFRSLLTSLELPSYAVEANAHSLVSVDGTALQAVVSFSTCHGRRVTFDCVTGKEDYCDPVADLEDDLVDYAERLPSAAVPALAMTVTSQNLLSKAAKDAGQKTMKLTYVMIVPSLLVLSVMLGGVRMLLPVLLAFLAAATSTYLILYPIEKVS